MTRYEVELDDEEADAFQACYPEPAHMPQVIEGRAGRHLADAIRAQRPNPPRMAEPDWQPQVMASTEDDQTHRGFTRTDLSRVSWVDSRGGTYSWDELMDPQPWTLGS